MGLLGILVALGLLIWLAFRGWSVLLLAPAAALIAAAISREPLLAHWTQTFMGSAASFLAQFFPLFLLGALFGKLMDDSGSVTAIAHFMTERMGARRAILAVVLAGALVTYGGVSLFVAFFVLAPMAQALFRAADIPRRLMPAGNRTRHLDVHDDRISGLARHPEARFRCRSLARRPLPRPALASWPRQSCWDLDYGGYTRSRTAARRAGEGYGGGADTVSGSVADDPIIRERATVAREFDPAEISRGHHSDAAVPIGVAVLPLAVVVSANLMMSLVILPRLDFSFLAEARWGATSLSAVAGVWSVAVALATAILVLIVVNYRRLQTLRESMDAGANASVLPAFSVASLVGFGAVVAMLPAFATVRDWVLTIGGGPLVSLAMATNVLAALTGSASGGMTIALDALGDTYMRIAAEQGIDPALMHRVAAIGSGTLDSLPHNGAVVTLLAVCGSTHRESYLDIVMVGIVGALIALVAVIALGSTLGSF